MVVHTFLLLMFVWILLFVLITQIENRREIKKHVIRANKAVENLKTLLDSGSPITKNLELKDWMILINNVYDVQIGIDAVRIWNGTFNKDKP